MTHVNLSPKTTLDKPKIYAKFKRTLEDMLCFLIILTEGKNGSMTDHQVSSNIIIN